MSIHTFKIGFCCAMLLIIPISVTANEDGTIVGNGIISTSKATVGSCKGIDINGAFNITIKQGKKCTIQVTGDSNIIPHIKSQVEKNNLNIYSDRSYSTKKVLELAIEADKPAELSINGSNSGLFSDLLTDQFFISLNGSSNFNLNGKVTTLSAKVNGSSMLNADALKADNIAISLTGAGSAEVNASKKLDISIVGAGSVLYRGNPEISREIIGVGYIEAK